MEKDASSRNHNRDEDDSTLARSTNEVSEENLEESINEDEPLIKVDYDSSDKPIIKEDTIKKEDSSFELSSKILKKEENVEKEINELEQELEQEENPKEELTQDSTEKLIKESDDEEISSNENNKEPKKNKYQSNNETEEKSEIDLGEILEEKKIEEKASKIILSSTVDEIDDEFVNKEKNAEELVEASLFIAGRFMSIEDLIMLTDLNQIMIKEILKKLKKKYSNCAITITERNNSYKMDIIGKYHYLINKLATGNAEFTKAEQETLAVIAYKQPIKQSVVIKIRGNKSYDHIKKFRQLGLVVTRPAGHTLELSLSEEFYEYFNIHDKNSES